MKRIINLSLLVILVVIIAFVFIKRNNYRDLFKLKAVKNVEGDRNIKELQKKASKYENLLKDKIDTSAKLGNVYKELGEKHLKHENWIQAIESLNKSIGYGHSSSRVHYMLGVAYANIAKKTNDVKKYDTSEFHYKEALKESPRYFEARYGLGLVLYYGKKLKKKGKVYVEQVVVDMPSFHSARFALARIYYEEGNLDKSLSTYESLLSDLDKKKSTKQIEKDKEQIKDNISRIMLEISGKR
jgi:tetratricopeptide (TPR) repeat protein